MFRVSMFRDCIVLFLSRCRDIRPAKYGLAIVCMLASVALLVTAGCYGGKNDQNDPEQPITHLPPSTTINRTSGRIAQGKPIGTIPRSGSAASDPGSKPMPRLGPEPVDGTKLAGNDACRSCHSSEFQVHHASNHAITLHQADIRSLGPNVPPAGSTGPTEYVIVEKGDKIYFTQDGEIAHGQQLQFALGSGKSGMTYVRVLNPDSLIEMRLSYFPNTKSWYFTPGQIPTADHTVGFQHTGPLGRGCVRCHSTHVDERTGVPERKFFGVGCESCHGPGKAHIDAMKAGNLKDIHMERLKSWDGKRLTRMCGQCHGNGDDIDPKNTMLSSQTNRFMAYGLMRSRCFTESNDRLSCITCHDAHSNTTSVSNAGYEAICLSCHAAPVSTPGSVHAPVAGDKPGIATGGATAGSGQTSGLTGEQVHAKTVCKVNPRTGCIGCHMPTTEIFPGLRLPTKMADHYIRVRADASIQK